MIRKDNRGALSLSKKGWIILFGSVLTVALAAWIILVAGIFRNKDRNDKDRNDKDKDPKYDIPKYDIPEIPEGYALVFRVKNRYSISEKGIRSLEYECEYDELGRLITKTSYTDSADVSDRVQYAYDDYGNEIRQTKYDEEWNIVSVLENMYDSEGRLKEKRLGDTVQTFNENGDLLTEYSIDGNGLTHKVKECIYTEDGRLLEETDLDLGDSTAFFYDNSGKKERIENRSYGNLFSVQIFLTEYTAESYILTDDGVRYLSERSEYDEDGNVIHLTGYKNDGTVDYEKIIERGEHGFETKVLTYFSNGDFTWYEYEYDEASLMYKRPAKTTSKNADGTVAYYIVDRYLPGMGRMEWMTYDPDAAIGEYGYYWGKDSYGNPIRFFQRVGGKDTLVLEQEYIPMAIPKEYMNDYDRYEK